MRPNIHPAVRIGAGVRPPVASWNRSAVADVYLVMPMKKMIAALVIVLAAASCAALESGSGQAPTPRPSPVATPSSPPPTAAPGRRLVPAPIDRLDVQALEPAPPRYLVNVLAGLPSGCAQRGTHTVDRQGAVITIAVLNSMPAGDPVCTMIYGTYELNVDLGTSFVSGTAYTVRVNDKTTSFTAR